MKTIHLLCFSLIIISSKIWAVGGRIDGNGDYILTDNELNIIYQDVAENIEQFGDISPDYMDQSSIKMTATNNLEDKKKNNSIKYSFEMGVVSSTYTIGSTKKDGTGFFVNMPFYRNERSDVFLHAEVVNYTADDSIPTLKVEHFAIGSNIQLFWTVKAMIMAGTATVSQTNPDGSSYSTKSTPPVIDYGITWSQPDSNPSFEIKITKRHYKLKDSLPLKSPGADISASELIYDTQSTNYAVGIKYFF